jgi:hypothetical protein
MFYSVFRSHDFLNILSKIALISDDNFSEILFNFLAVRRGKHKRLNLLYLMREYPRPAIYNIPEKFDWFSSDIFSRDLSVVARILSDTADGVILESTLFRYLSKRIYSLSPSLFDRIRIRLFKVFFGIRFFLEIKSFTSRLRNIY